MELRKRIADIVRSKKTQIPTLPVIVQNVLNIANDETASARNLADFICQDQAMSNKVLRLANSAYYGAVGEVASIQRAITVIGFNEVISLAIGMGVFSSFKKMDTHGIFSMRELWLHSIGCAVAAKELAKTLGSPSPDQAFLNGLLHDMGKVIFAVYFPEAYGRTIKSAHENQSLLLLEEKETFGLDHAVLSALLMERWHFPEEFQIPSSCHHRSLECRLDCGQTAAVVQVADALCHRADIGYSGNPVIPDVSKISRFLKLTESSEGDVIALLEERRPKIEAFFESIRTEKDRRNVCGVPGIYALLKVLGPTRGELLRYEKAVDEAADSVVTFAGAAFYERKESPP